MTKRLWSNRKNLIGVLAVLAFLISFAGLGRSQSTSFNYQGSLKDGGTAANGSFQMQFKLFDSLSGGGQIGSTITDVPVTVTQGVFNVSLDFGSNALSGANRWLEIAVRHNSGESYVTLAPRNQIASSPYSVRTLSAASADGLSSNCVACVQDSNISSLSGAKVTGTVSNASNAANATTATNATQLGGVAANQYVVTTDPRMTDARSPTAGSASYIQNQNAGAQASSNFNITGTGNAGVFDAVTQYNIAGARAFGVSAPNNVFAGTSTASTGNNNSFFGNAAGQGNTTGGSNSFFGSSAGQNNQIGNNNAFFGRSAGQSNTSGGGNAFFGQSAGTLNVSGSDNAFFGRNAGKSAISSHNSFFGEEAGQNTTSGSGNTVVGYAAGGSNVVENNNTFVGSQSDGAAGITNATVIGANAQVTQSNSLVLGSINGINGAAADTNVGIGTTAPTQKLHVVGNGLFTGNLTVNGTLNATLPAGSANYIQNQDPTTVQPSSNFHVSGTGAANIMDVATQYSIGGFRVLIASAQNTNTFVGVNAGGSFGSGSQNSFFGYAAGSSNAFGNANAFFGEQAGFHNTDGSSNVIVGRNAGFNNTTGNNSSFFGTSAGINNTTGGNNAFFGTNAGSVNVTGSDNTLIGNNANLGSGALTFATALGSGAGVSTSNTVVLGRGADTVQVPGNLNVTGNVGIGTASPERNLHVFAGSAGTVTADVSAPLVVESNSNAFVNILSPDGAEKGILFGGPVSQFDGSVRYNNSGNLGGLQFRTNGNATRMVVTSAGDVGVGTTIPAQKLDVQGDIRIGTSGTNGCLQNRSGGVIGGTCSSDLRFKRNITPFGSVLNNFSKLRPVNFYWRTDEFAEKHFGPEQSYGLIAQEVEQVFPDLVSTDEQGYKAVNYSKLPLLTIQAVREQQSQIEAQQKQIDEQQKQIESLAKIVCAMNPKADICRQ